MALLCKSVANVRQRSATGVDILDIEIIYVFLSKESFENFL